MDHAYRLQHSYMVQLSVWLSPRRSHTRVICLSRFCFCSARDTICWFPFCSLCSASFAALRASGLPVCVASSMPGGMGLS